jgi:inosose dehydratase
VLEFGDEQTGTGQAAGFDQVLDEIASSGYAGTELGDWGFLPTDAAALREALGARELELLAAFVPVALARPEAHGPGVEVALRTARLLAETATEPWIVLADDNGSDPLRTARAGRIQPGDTLDDLGSKTFISGAERIAREVFDETGVRTVFHHHCGGFIETPQEVDRLLDGTDPEVLGLCLDTGHYTFGGGDAVKGLSRYGDRVWHVHFKDCHRGVAERARTEHLDYFQAVSEGIFCELGRGQVDFEAVIRLLRARDYRGWIVVEQDVLPGMGSPLESARRNRAYLRDLGI